jgi:hypothetical protein
MLQASDIVARQDGAYHRGITYLNEWCADGSSGDILDSNYRRVVTYGSKPIIRHLVDRKSATTSESAEHTARWILAAYKHVDYILKKPELVFPLFAPDGQTSVTVKHAGIESMWSLDTIDRMFGISLDAVARAVAPVAEFADDEVLAEYSSFNSSRVVFMLLEPRLSSAFIGDSSKPALQRAWFSAKREQIVGRYFRSLSVNSHHNRGVSFKLDVADNSVSLQAYRDALLLAELMSVKPSIYDVQQQRSSLLSAQVNQQRQESRQRELLSAQNFTRYWDTMKSRVRSLVPDVDITAEQFAQIPLQPEGTETSRTWGIEVETVQAQLTSRPAGWQAVHDGSLNSGSSGDCDCSCDSCYESDHCDDSNNECYYESDSEAMEYVSPVLKHFNSNGLRHLCNDLPDNESDTSPGIHVHVDASDLTVTDVARLLVSYSVIAPLLQPLYHRQTYGYCNEMASDNIAWWLGAARKQLALTGSVPSPRDICESQPASRYQDVNVHAIYKHGTVEFRAMGPYYNYDHLVRWAWFCREMVNVSKLGIEQREWTRCRSLTDAINLLRKYGTELPSDKQFNNINTQELALAYSEE